jgi:polyvinyl alcohol dehydrogenase (cytochrome)
MGVRLDGDMIVFSLPSVTGNNIFVGSASGLVHALDARSGCEHWSFKADDGVRTATVLPGKSLLFGDRGGYFYTLDAETGKLLWKKKLDDHAATRLTGAPAVHDGIAFVPIASSEETSARDEQYACCSFRRSVVALRVSDGSQVWKTYSITETPHKIGMAKSGAEEWGHRRRHLVGSNARSQARPVVCHNGRQLFALLFTAWRRRGVPGFCTAGNS